MQCPRCKRPNAAGAQLCVFCGAALQSTHPDLSDTQARLPSVQSPDVTDGVWREEPRPGPGEDAGNQLPPWLMASLGQTGQVPAATPPADAWNGQIGQIGQMPWPASSPELGQTPSHNSGPSILPGGGVMPLMGGLSNPARQPTDSRNSNISSSPALNGRLAISPTFAEDAVRAVQRSPRGTGALVQALGPGTLLKGGRYRLLQRFYPVSTLEPQGNEPPLMIASDTEFPDLRVLVQELPLHGERPEEAERMRREIAERFQTTARAGGVAPLVDQFSEHRRHFLVFELPSGEPLLVRLQRRGGAMPETTAIGYALQVLDVLENFERERPPFIHGNLSPANIILRPSGQATLVGCSSILLMHPDGIVERGQAGGIPGYAGPEQVRGQASTRSDLFAVCAVLHHAVTGIPPAPRATAMHPPARHLNPQVSLELEELLSHGLRPAPNQRFESAHELRRALQPLATGRIATHVPEDLRLDVPQTATPAIVPVRDARGRLVLPKRRASQNPLVLIGAMVCLVVLLGVGVLFALSPGGPRTAGQATPTPNTLAALFQSKGISLSGGEFIFDTQRGDNNEKQHASLALASNDVRTALAGFQSAVSEDQADAEAAIYAADLQIRLDKDPFVTVVAAVAFGSDADIALAREELQGVYLAQQRINEVNPLPGGLKVRVLILNSGPATDDASTAAAVLLQEFQNGNAQHLVGVVGWPESDQTRLAISTLAPSGLAVVSPTADADSLSGNPGNFFAIVPSLSQQSEALADALVTQLHAVHILVLGDSHDPTSNAIATHFLNRVNQNHQYAAQGVTATRASFTTGATTDFDATVQSAILAGDDWIFLAGGAQDSIYLAQSVAKLNARYGTALRVLVGTQADTPALFGVSGDPTDPTAALASSDPSVLQWLDVAAFADKGEWTDASVDEAPPSFFDDYAAQYGINGEPSGFGSAGATSILSYDAASVLLAAEDHAVKVADGTTELPTPTQVRQRLLQFTAGSPFMGIGGAIAFTVTGSQPQKSLAILALQPVQNPTQGQPVAQTTIAAVTGGHSSFCGGANARCTAS